MIRLALCCTALSILTLAMRDHTVAVMFAIVGMSLAVGHLLTRKP